MIYKYVIVRIVQLALHLQCTTTTHNAYGNYTFLNIQSLSVDRLYKCLHLCAFQVNAEQ